MIGERVNSSVSISEYKMANSKTGNKPTNLQDKFGGHMALFSNPFKSPKNIIDSDSGDWICPRCGVIVNLTDVTRCVCGYDKTAPPPPTKTTPTKTTPAIPQEDKSTISEKDSLSIKNISLLSG